MEKLIVISSPACFPEEPALVNKMCAAGLGLFHLRKPGWKIEEIMRLLDKIDNAFYSRIAVHQHHEAAIDYGIKRLHFPETKRYPAAFSRDISYSTSVHTQDAYEGLDTIFSYTFYSPVFPGISKKDNREPVDMAAASTVTKRVKMVALSGIAAHNCLVPFQYGFDSVAVLGAVWENSDPLAAFKQIQACITTGL